jgi:hypothetical protein
MLRLRALALPIAAILLTVGMAGPARAEEALDVAADPSPSSAERELADAGPFADLLRRLRSSHSLSASGEQIFRSVEGVIPRFADRSAAPDSLALARDPLALTTSWTDGGSTSLSAVAKAGESWHLMRFKATADSLAANAKISTYGQIAYLPRDAQVGNGNREDSQEPISLGVRWEVGDVEGGAEYRSFGNRLDQVVAAPQAQKDQEGSEVWLARRLGLVRLRLGHSALSDNVDRNPALPRTTKDQTGLTAELRVPEWPIFGLTYAVGDSEKVWLTALGSERTRQRAAFDSVIGSLYYHGEVWEVNASSTYAQSRDAVRPRYQTTSLYHDLSLTLHLLDVVTLVPAISTGADWSDSSRSSTGTTSLTLSYDPAMSSWHMWTYASYAASQISDHAMDARTVSVSGGIRRDLGTLWVARASVALEVGYTRYVDIVTRDSSSQGASALLLLKAASF